MELTAIQRNTCKIIAAIYMIGGIFGAIFIAPQIFYIKFDLISVFVYLFVISQIAAALFGGWTLWQSKKIGMQILYWLSWLSVPLIETSLIAYYSAYGIGIIPTFLIDTGRAGFNLAIHLGYDSALFFMPNISGITAGVNLVAVIMLVALAKIMKSVGIRKWLMKANS